VTEAEFEYVRTLLKARAGLALSPEKRYLVESRLAPVCRRFNAASLSDLIGRLKGGLEADVERSVVEAMTTNETFFFRDRAPFELFQKVLLPHFLAARAAKRRIRIWCAAASTGQEPYSLAMLLDQREAELANWRIEILATDISSEVLERAKAGCYSQFEVQRGLSTQLLLKYFTQAGDQWQLAPAVRARVEFKTLNLIHDFSHLGQFDLIFCRNVLIYFDPPTKASVLQRMADILPDDGMLVLGAAETVIGLSNALVPHREHRGIYVPKRTGARSTSPAPLAAGHLWPM
jgi:chemotaxis protein methyltransferase CheR